MGVGHLVFRHEVGDGAERVEAFACGPREAFTFDLLLIVSRCPVYTNQDVSAFRDLGW